MRRTIWTTVALVSVLLVAARYVPQVSLANLGAMARGWITQLTTWLAAMNVERIPWELIAPITALVASAVLAIWLSERNEHLVTLFERGWSPARISKKTEIAQDGVRMVLGSRNIRSLDHPAHFAGRNIRPVGAIRARSTNLRNETGLRRRHEVGPPGTRLATARMNHDS